MTSTMASHAQSHDTERWALLLLGFSLVPGQTPPDSCLSVLGSIYQVLYPAEPIAIHYLLQPQYSLLIP
jgi:hypothetical protein